MHIWHRGSLLDPMHMMGRRRGAKWRLNTIDAIALVAACALCAVTVYEVRQHSQGYGRGRRPDIIAAEAERFFDEHLSTYQDNTMMCIKGDKTHVDYDGIVLNQGSLQDTPQQCCQACSQKPDCNVWVWCGRQSGCSNSSKFRECWLKQSDILTVISQDALSQTTAYRRGISAFSSQSTPKLDDGGWMSGSAFDKKLKTKVIKSEQQRLDVLRFKSDLPLVFMDITIKGWPVGRIEMVLFKDVAPIAAENFRALCTGEKGFVPKGHKGAGKPYTFKGTAFYLIVDQIMNVAGAGTESIYGGSFHDEEEGLALKHDRPGLLTLVNDAEDINTSDFAITLLPSPNLDGKYVVFGEVVAGMDVVRKINQVARGKPNDTAGIEEQVIIADSGELFRT